MLSLMALATLRDRGLWLSGLLLGAVKKLMSKTRKFMDNRVNRFYSAMFPAKNASFFALTASLTPIQT
jgi:hypothetical protein